MVAFGRDEEPVVAFTNLTRLFEALAVALADASMQGRTSLDPDAFRAAHASTNPDLILPAHVTEP